MVLDIMQTTNGANNHFLVFGNGALWYHMDYNGNGTFPSFDSVSTLQLKDAGGNLVFFTNCFYKQQLQDESNSLKSMFGSSAVNKYQVCTAAGVPVGAFYEAHDSAFKGPNLCIEFQGRLLVGKRKWVRKSIFPFTRVRDRLDRYQKKGFSFHNRDAYTVHFLADFNGMTPVMAFFVAFFDYKYHNASIVPRFGKRSTSTHNIGANGYNENFIPYYFGQGELTRMDNFFNIAAQGMIPYPMPQNFL